MLRFAFFGFPFILLSFIGLSAQTNNSGLMLNVVDQVGGAIDGAEIVLERSGDKDRLARTDQNGAARFQRISPGEYQLIVRAAGFNEYRIPKLVIPQGEVQKLDVFLEILTIESNVDVVELEADPQRSGVTTVLSEKEIAELPDNQEDLERTLRRLGEAVTGEQLPITVNGVEGGQIPPKQAIQQIRINQNVFSAQYDAPHGGGIEIFTRSGVDRMRGSFGFSFADSRFNAKDPFLGARVPFQSRSFYANVFGPLGGKKANFAIFTGRSESDTSSVINAIILGPDLRPVEFKQTFASPSRTQNLGFAINADPNKKHKLLVDYNFGHGRSAGQNVGGFSLPSRQNETVFNNHYFQFADTFLVSSSIVSQTRFSLVNLKNESFGGSDDAALNVLDAFFGGGSQQNAKNTNLRMEASNDTTWQKERYSFGLGFRLRYLRIGQTSFANFGGTYTFAGRIAPILDANNMPVTDGGGVVLTEQISSLESYRRTLLFRQLGYSPAEIRALGGGANQFTISGGDPDISISQYDVGIYFQSSFKLTDSIAASAGLRYENQTNIGSNYNLAPRLGLVWAPKAKEKRSLWYALPRISIGYGLFYSRYGLNNMLGIRLANDSGRSQYLITDTNILDLFPTVPTVGQLQQFALPRSQRYIEDGFETPYQAFISISATKALPKKYSLNFTFSRGRTSRVAFTQNINAPLAGTFDPQDPSSAERPFGNVGNIYESRSLGRTETERMSVSLSFPQSPSLFASFRYSYGTTRSDVVSGSGSPFDPHDFSQDYGPSQWDGMHSGGGFSYYNFTKQKLSLSGDFSINSGTRFNIITGRDTNGEGYYSERPAFASDLARPGVVSTKYGILDPNPSPGDRLIPINLGRGPVSIMFNASITKRFGFNEDKANKKPPNQNLFFTLRTNNLFNIINKGNPVGNMSSPNFLRTLAGFSDGSIFFINGARQVNFPGRSISFSVGFSF
ncbi:hypothetical protein BH20ACI2_BH20ACI2_11250 [soil metagenome]